MAHTSTQWYPVAPSGTQWHTHKVTNHPGGGGVAREEGPFAVPMAMKAVSSAPAVAAPKEDEGEGLVAMAAVAAGSAGPVASVAMAAVMVAEFAAPAAFAATEEAAAAGSADLAPSAVVVVVVVVAMGEADLVSARPVLAAPTDVSVAVVPMEAGVGCQAAVSVAMAAVEGAAAALPLAAVGIARRERGRKGGRKGGREGGREGGRDGGRGIIREERQHLETYFRVTTMVCHNCTNSL